MDMNKTRIEDVHVVAISGRIDAITSRELESVITKLLSENPAKVVLDLKDAQYMSSSGLRVLMAAKNRLKGTEGDLRLAALGPLVMEVFEITGVKQFFSIYSSRDEAIRSFVKG